MSYQLFWEPEGVYTELSGFVSNEEFVRSVTDVQSDSRFDEMRYLIIDLSKVSGHELNKNTFAYLAAINIGAQVSNPNCRVVYVTTDKAVAAIIDETFKSPELISYVVDVKPSVTSARDWLDSQPRQDESSVVMGFRFR